MSGAWTRKEGKNPAGGLNAKGRASAKKEGQQEQMVDPSALRVKGGLQGQATAGGHTNDATMNLARALQAKEDLPGGISQFTAFDDEYHHKANPKSKHTEGLAMDFSLKDASKVANDMLERKDIIESKPQQEQIEKTVDDRLAKLAEQFRAFAKPKEKDITPQPLVI